MNTKTVMIYSIALASGIAAVQIPPGQPVGQQNRAIFDSSKNEVSGQVLVPPGQSMDHTSTNLDQGFGEVSVPPGISTSNSLDQSFGQVSVPPGMSMDQASNNLDQGLGQDFVPSVKSMDQTSTDLDQGPEQVIVPPGQSMDQISTNYDQSSGQTLILPGQSMDQSLTNNDKGSGQVLVQAGQSLDQPSGSKTNPEKNSAPVSGQSNKTQSSTKPTVYSQTSKNTYHSIRTTHAPAASKTIEILPSGDYPSGIAVTKDHVPIAKPDHTKAPLENMDFYIQEETASESLLETPQVPENISDMVVSGSTSIVTRWSLIIGLAFLFS